MSDTPETDNHPLWHGEPAVHIDFARKLERERDEARAERDEWIARFRADEQLIKEAMEELLRRKPEPKYEYPLPKAYQNFCSADCPQ